MKTIDIKGDNYFGYWDKTRAACRGIVLKEDEILVSFETKTNQYMIPGGGLENNEDEKTCCMREVAEETGILTEVSDCVLEIDEYYEDCKWINWYYVCKQKGSTEMHLTKQEQEVGMEPRWIKLSEVLEVFSKHADYSNTDEMRRGMYLREYTALCEILDPVYES